MAANATELYIEMVHAIKQRPSVRTVTDPLSPRRTEVVEALPGRRFVLRSPYHNRVMCVPVDERYCRAMALHFFAATELATPLAKLGGKAAEFLQREADDYYWRGAYGHIAMPQVEKCVELLREHPTSRRAIVSMGDVYTQDTHRPACWSFLHFLRYDDTLYMLVTQRSLNLQIVPCDCVVLTELWRYVCAQLDVQPGEMVWNVGNLHAPNKPGWDAYEAACFRANFVQVTFDEPWEQLCALFN